MGQFILAGDGNAKDVEVFHDVHSLDFEAGLVVFSDTFDPADSQAKTWKEEQCGGSPPTPRWGHTADVSADGKMWVYGGQNRGPSAKHSAACLKTCFKL